MVEGFGNLLILPLILAVVLFMGLEIVLGVNALCNLSPFRKLIVAFGSGFGMLSLILFLLGILHILYLPVVILVCLIPALLHFRRKSGFIASIGYSGYWKTIKNASPLYLIIGGLLLVTVLLNFLRAFVPITDHDSLESYLYVPKFYAQHHAISQLAFTKWDDLPLTAEMITTLGLLIKNEILSKLLTGFTLGVLSMLVIYAAGTLAVNRKTGLVAALMFYLIPEVLWITNTVKVDLAWAFFEFLAFFLFLAWNKSRNRQEQVPLLYFAFIFLGLGLGTKYVSLLTLIFVNLVLLGLFFARQWKLPFSSLAGILLKANLAAIILALPYFIKNYLYTGNPVFPYLFSPHYEVDAVRSYSGASGILDYYWNLFFLRDFPAAKMVYTGSNSFGSLIIAFLPAVLLCPKKQQKMLEWFILVWFIYTLTMMLSSSPQPRHLLNTIPLLIIPASAGAVSLLEKKGWIRICFFLAFLYPSLFTLKVKGNEFLRNDLKVVAGLETNSQYLDRTLFSKPKHMHREMMDYIKTELPPEAMILTMYYCNAYYVDRPMTIDYNLESRFMFSEKDPDKLAARLHALGITHVYLSDTDYQTREDVWRQKFAMDKTIMFTSSFQSKYLEPVITFGEQHLYLLKYPVASLPDSALNSTKQHD